MEKNLITYDGNKINPDEVAGYNYEKIRFRIQGILTVQYKVNLIDKRGNEFKIHFSSGGINEDNMDKHYSRILNELRIFCGVRLLNEMNEGLLQGKEFAIGKTLKVKPQGVSFIHKPLFAKGEEKILRWEDIDFSISDMGSLLLKGLGEEKSEISSAFYTTNTIVLYWLLNWLHEDSDRIAAIYSANKIEF